MRGQIAARHLLWSLVIGYLLREFSFHAVEALVGSKVRRALGVGLDFGDDALAYFTERLDPEPTRRALVQALIRRSATRLSTRGDLSEWRSIAQPRAVVRVRGAAHTAIRKVKSWLSASRGDGQHCRDRIVVAADIEPYGPGDREYSAGKRLLRRMVAQMGTRFAKYVVVDGGFATSPFLHTADDLGLKVIAPAQVQPA